MTCDEVFDALTDPRAIDAPALAAHLARCRRCRDLQAVLEPALSAIRADAAGNWPAENAPQALDGEELGSSSRASMEAVDVAKQTADSLSRRATGDSLSRRATAGRPRADL